MFIESAGLFASIAPEERNVYVAPPELGLQSVFATMNITLLTESRRYDCLEYLQVLSWRVRKLTICATPETVPELRDPANYEILFGPTPRSAGPHSLHP